MGQNSSRQNPYGYPPGYGQYGGYGDPSYSNYSNYNSYGSMPRDPYASHRRRPRRSQTMPMYMPSMPMTSPPMPYQAPAAPMYGYPSAFPQMICELYIQSNNHIDILIHELRSCCVPTHKPRAGSAAHEDRTKHRRARSADASSASSPTTVRTARCQPRIGPYFLSSCPGPRNEYA